MAWMNVLQLEERYIDPEFRKAFVELFTLRTFLSRCLVQSEYKPPDTLGEAISLTPIGKEWVSRTQAAIKDISEQEINLAFFLKFFHHDLFIDVNHTNTETIRQVLDADIIGGKIKYRWVYNRTLYDRFFEMFSVSTRELPYEETMKLLDNTPQGVFQLRDFVVGSFGVLYSSCIRFLLPTRSAALWHCSDPSCEALHSVRLSTGNNKVEEAIAFISNESEKIYGSPSDWENFFRHTGFPEALDYHDDMYPQLFPWLIANAFSETEIRNILRMLIDQHSKQLRERFPKTYRFKDMLLGSAEKISKGLTKAQCFQLILLMPNESIANCIEL